MDPMICETFVVPERDSGKRLDAFLSDGSRSCGRSRREVREGIESGLVSVNGKPVAEPRKRVRMGDRVESRLPERVEETLTPNPDVPFDILYEDRDLLVIDKPAGVQMHPGGTDTTGTVANRIAAEYPSMREVGSHPLRPGIVHRLDRNTSGVVVLAKTVSAYERLRDLFGSRVIRKTYLALVSGRVREESGVIDLPLAARTGTLRRQVVKDPSEISGKVRDAVTEYRVIGRYCDADLLEIFPKTGRTHQIRIHLAAIGNPVMGDRLYGGRQMRREGMPDRQLLHAFRLSFPFEGRDLVFEAPLPPDFREFLGALDGAEEAGYPDEASNRHGGA
ncbi:MAG: RluA family pseudouridine synthase [Candidatus Moranbacteria bacterium]|nr:RluA family pseudouridine synthase [Candidatus Moranbacteria bacterium]